MVLILAQVRQVQLLGGFSLIDEDRPVAHLIQGRSQLLLAYLALHRVIPQPRQRIAFQLWPESTDAQARTNLRKALSQLRRSLPNADELIQIDPKSLQWSPTNKCELDVAAFEAAVQSAERAREDATRQPFSEKAIQLYQGDLLPNWDDDWLVPERERLRQLFQRSLEQLIQLLEYQQNYTTAIPYAQQMIRLDSLNEAAYGTLMRLQYGTGDRANALQTYHQCMTVLRDELGVDPGVATRQLYEQVLHETAIPAAPPPLVTTPSTLLLATPRSAVAQPPLVGRETEWATIQYWSNPLLTKVHQASQDSPGATSSAPILLLLGEPGIGKTRLLAELRATIQAANGLLLWGCGFAAEMMRPYGIWIDALRSSNIAATTNLPTELGFLLPELGQPEQTLPDPSHLFDAVVSSLLQWADQSPLLLLFDDLQWMDDASAALLHYVIRVLRHYPLQIACTARPGELTANTAIADVLKALRREQRLHTLDLTPLNQAQTRELLGRSGTVEPSELSPSLVNQLFTESGGNPLFILELAKSQGYRPDGSSTLESLIGDRLQQLDDHARGILPWAAAMGRSFDPATVAQVADYPITQLLTAIEALEQQSIICPHTSRSLPGNYSFTHDIVRQIVYDQLSTPRQQLIHQQIAHHLYQRIEVDPAIASDIAHHALLGGNIDLATRMSILAAQQSLQVFAYATAVEHVHKGIEAAQQLPARDRIQRQAKLLNLGSLAGVQGVTAVQLTEWAQQRLVEAQAQQLPEAEANARESLMILRFNQSDFDSVYHHTLQATATQRVANPAVVARTLAYSGCCLAEIGRDIPRAEALLQEAQSLGERVGVENFDIAAGLGLVQRHYGRYDEARSLICQALHLIRLRQEHWRECVYLSYLAMIELEDGNPTAVSSHTAAILTAAAQIQGEGSEAAAAQALAALAQYQLRETAAESLNPVVAALQRTDAKRMLAYTLMSAAAIDLEDETLSLAYKRASMALDNARAINHPSEIACSWAILIHSLFRLGDEKHAQAELRQLQTIVDVREISTLAQQAIAQALQAFE
ncbi:MAG: BTAD domain-containing putative transcriptional regulator [Cyanobacteria bacterium P01_D01_bin.115]